MGKWEKERAALRRKKERRALRLFPFPYSPIRLFPLLLFVLVLATACGTDNLYLSSENEPGMMPDKKNAPVNYVALGDSTGVGVGARDGGYVARLFDRINRERPSSRLTNLCMSGATSGDVLREQLKPALAARPTLVTLGIGINDIGRGVPEETFARNYEEIIAGIKKETSAHIVVTNLPDISLAPAVPASLREQVRSRVISFNKRIKETADRHGLLVVDAYSTTRDLIPTHPEFFSADNFHPSDAGYEYWAKLMWPTVKEAIEK
jgi:acyl-CoA thioesterase-1